MRCLIYAKSADLFWLQEYFPRLDPYLLKLVNKPLLEYSLDFISLQKVSEVRIVSDSSVNAIEDYFKDGAKWGVNISYSLAKPDDSLEDVILKNYSFCKDHDMLYWEGFFFIQYNRKEQGEELRFEKSLCFKKVNKRLIYLLKGETLKAMQTMEEETGESLKIREINSVVDYYKLSMEILNDKSQSYVLPGYSNDTNAYLGINIVYPNSSEINPPVMIGNGCRFQKYTIIGPNCIIGDNVLVDNNSIITESIVYDNTYIGSELDIHQKIVYGNLLFSGISGEIIHISDKILVSAMEQDLVISLFNRFTQVFFSLIFLGIQLIPWTVLFLPYRLITGFSKSYYLMNKGFGLEGFVDPKLLIKTWYGRQMMRLCLDKFGQFWNVILGKLLLVGNCFYSNSTQNRKLVRELPVYSPGVFSLTETVKITSQDVKLFYELEYIAHVSTMSNFRILTRNILRRLLHPAEM